jgi:hypothetical protein
LIVPALQRRDGPCAAPAARNREVDEASQRAIVRLRRVS